MSTATLLLLVYIGLVVGFAALYYLIHRKLTELKAPKDDAAMTMLNQNVQTMQSQVNERLDKAASVIGQLQHQLGAMTELGRSIKDIQDVLRSPKLRGNIGEQLMTDLIRQQIPKNNYQMQYAFRSGEKVDAVIKTKNGLIPIDSKFPAENYLKYVQSKDEALKPGLYRKFTQDVKGHIQDIAKKYILPGEGTVDFALMYVPGEAVYYEIMMNTDLCDYGASQKVYLVSPQSFYHFLGSVLLGLEGQLIEERAKEVMRYLKDIQGDTRRFGGDLTLVNKHLTNAKNAGDVAQTSFNRLSGKVEAANQLTGEKVEQIVEKVEPLVGVSEPSEEVPEAVESSR